MAPILMFSLQCYKDHIYDNCIFNNLVIYGKCLIFQFLTCGMRKESPNQTWGRNEHKSVAREVVIIG